MRKILFRGKTEKFGNWIEGNLIVGRDLESGQLIYLIAPLSAYYTEVKKVIPETVGQYTGLTDKNGKKIFEGDILRFAYNEEDKDPKIYSVEWKSDRACFGYAETADKMLEIDTFHWEVIGNIHDNPEVSGGE